MSEIKRKHKSKNLFLLLIIFLALGFFSLILKKTGHIVANENILGVNKASADTPGGGGGGGCGGGCWCDGSVDCSDCCDYGYDCGNCDE